MHITEMHMHVCMDTYFAYKYLHMLQNCINIFRCMHAYIHTSVHLYESRQLCMSIFYVYIHAYTYPITYIHTCICMMHTCMSIYHGGIPLL